MLSASQLQLINQTIAKTLFNRVVTIKDASGTILATGINCYIEQMDSENSLSGQDVMNSQPVDARLRIQRSDFIRPGNKILVTSANNVPAAGTTFAALYSILTVSDLGGIGIQTECSLFKESGVVG
jgi:hypothetical protein